MDRAGARHRGGKEERGDRRDDRAMTNRRRPLGTETNRADASRTPDTDPTPAPRAQLAAERLTDVPVALVPAEQRTAPLAKRRTLGTRRKAFRSAH
uniref:hypothetical protein n=1 Tax=Streptomyces cellulosae TaxID=1968 RepID=UPI002F913BAF